MRFPEFIKKGDTIGYVAPSMGCATEPYLSGLNRGIDIFKELGYKSKLGPNVYLDEGIGISNSPLKCAEELLNEYVSDDTAALISCGGGELMCKTIAYLDFDKIKTSKPKWYMGYSDNTNFIFLLTTICDVAGIYGYCASTFGRQPYHESLLSAIDILTGEKLSVHSYDKYEIKSLKDEEHPLVPFNCTLNTMVKAMKPSESDDGVTNNCFYDDRTSSDISILNDKYTFTDEISFSGRLVGGCLDCLVNLTGTRFDQVASFNERYKEDGIIWFLECCDLNVFDMERAMWHLNECGWFKYVKGFIIGRPVKAEGFMGLNRFDAFLNTIQEFNVPVIFDADIGHVPPMMPIISGAYADVNFKDGHLDIDMSSVVK